MSREVCGICWCPYDDITGECACPPPSVQKSTLREAATKALEALEYGGLLKKRQAITALKAALDNYDAELAEIDSDGARCGVYNLPAWCEIHQHHKWCEHNGGKMGPTGWEKP